MASLASISAASAASPIKCTGKELSSNLSYQLRNGVWPAHTIIVSASSVCGCLFTLICKPASSTFKYYKALRISTSQCASEIRCVQPVVLHKPRPMKPATGQTNNPSLPKQPSQTSHRLACRAVAIQDLSGRGRPKHSATSLKH